MTDLLEYTAEELTGRNLYNLCHAEDADKLKKSHMDREYLKMLDFVGFFATNKNTFFFIQL